MGELVGEWSVAVGVGVGVGNIPDIGPIPFQIIEQKLAQHSETHIEAQSCKSLLSILLEFPNCNLIRTFSQCKNCSASPLLKVVLQMTCFLVLMPPLL